MKTLVTLPGYYLIYNADGTVIGEISYITKKLLKQTSCSACDITHSFSEFGEKQEFKACRARLPEQFYCIHRNDMDEAMNKHVQELPVLLKRTETAIETIFKKAELDQFQGSVSAFEKEFLARIQNL